MADLPLAVELHDTYCTAGDWPHDVECVAFEGYEVAANPLLTVLAGRGCARRADVPEVQAAEPHRAPTREQIEEEVREALDDLAIVAYPTSAENDADEPMHVDSVVGHVAGYVLALLRDSTK